MNYDLIVVGAGPGGFDAAIHAAKLGKTVALVEKDEIGGTCLNRGCIPTKTFLHTAHLIEQIAAHGEEIGIKGGVTCDFAQLKARKNTVLEQLRAGMMQQLKTHKVTYIAGTATVMEAGKVLVAQENGECQELLSDRILLATGASPIKPPIPGIDLPGVITSDDLFLEDFALPGSIAIIGGGVIGIEIAYALSVFGVQVSVIESMERVLPTVDREISQNLQMIFKKSSISINTGATVKEIRQEDGLLQVSFSAQAGGEHTVSAETVLVATGRRAFTERLFGEGFAATMERGALVADEDFQTSIPGIYAIGDVVAGTMQLAHVASSQGVAAVCSMFGLEAERDLSVVPSCIYTDPEIACAGLTADEAKARGIPVRVGKALMGANGKSVLTLQKRGFIKLVTHAETGELLGAALMCANATDMIGEFVSAIGRKMTALQLMRAIRPHPTFNEAVTAALEALAK